MTLPLTDSRTGLRRGPIRWSDGTPPPADGCRWCGTPLPQHASTSAIRQHSWEQPTAAQIQARIKASRKASGLSSGWREVATEEGIR